MLTVKQAADQIEKHPNTIRKWTSVYSDALSTIAKGTGGKERRFAEDDMTVMWTIAVLKSEGKHTEDIKTDLATGLRIEPILEPKTEDVPKNGAASGENVAKDGPTVQEASTMALELVKGQVDSLTNERDYLRDELEKERIARIDAETDAARLSAEVEAARAAGQLEAIYRRHWWQVWRPERPGE